LTFEKSGGNFELVGTGAVCARRREVRRIVKGVLENILLTNMPGTGIAGARKPRERRAMRRVFLLLSACLVMSLVLAPSAIAQSVENGPTSYDISEFNPNGPCFDPESASSVSGVPVEDLANAFLNRNDPPGTPISSPLDPDGDGIACNSLTQEEAKELGRDAYILSESEDGYTNQGFTLQRAEICQGLFPAKPPNSNVPGEGDLKCFETAEQAKTFAETGQTPSEDTGATEETSSVTAEQYAEDTGTVGTLPATGGPPLGVIGAGLGLLLVAGGLLLKRHLT
jgi:hypothetical protein